VQRSFAVSGFLLFTSACGSPEPTKAPAKSSEEVPANSFKDEPKPAASNETVKDPTQPYMTKMGDAPPSDPGDKGKPSKGTPSTPSTASGSSGGGSGKVSQAECDQMFDKLIELEIASNPQLKGAGPEVVAMAKDMAKQRGGAPPCTATHKEYSCAMAASSTAAWKRCVK